MTQDHAGHALETKSVAEPLLATGGEMTDHWATEFKAVAGPINVDEAQGIIECFVAAIGNKDSVGDIVMPGAFDASLKRRKPRVVWGHNWNEPIGKVLDIFEVPPGDRRLPGKMKVAGVGGLYARVQFNLRSERGKQAFADVAFFGEDQEWSIGYKTITAEFDTRRQANLLRELELYEVSPVLHGANQLTATLSVKADDPAMAAQNPVQGREGVLARALAAAVGGRIRLRAISGDSVIFDQMDDAGAVTTHRVRVTERDGEFAFGAPERVVALRPAQPAPTGQGWSDRQHKEPAEVPAEVDDDEEVEFGEEVKAPRPSSAQINQAASAISSRVPTGSNLAPDVLPQERVTGDILRGYGPRRGNLEKLLRYWRPIMRQPGGFRRCLAILADHPELYPLKNLCAWLHHETTGLWPNEGCHHPTMKNCRRKLKNIVRGSIISDRDFDARLNRIGRRKGLNEWVSADDPDDDDEDDPMLLLHRFVMRDGAEMYEDEDEDDPSDRACAAMLKDFVNRYPEWVRYLGDDDNWEVEGDLDDGLSVAHPIAAARSGCGGCAGCAGCDGGGHAHGGGGCGCGGTCGGCGGHGKADDLNVISEHQALTAEVATKAGRVLSSANVAKLQQASDLLRQVLQTGGIVEMKVDHVVSAPVEDLFHLREALDPVIEYHDLDAEVTLDGIYIKHLGSEEAVDALAQVVANFNEIHDKGVGRRAMRALTPGLTSGLGDHGAPSDGDGDGFYARTPGAPDTTPVAKAPDPTPVPVRGGRNFHELRRRRMARITEGLPPLDRSSVGNVERTVGKWERETSARLRDLANDPAAQRRLLHEEYEANRLIRENDRLILNRRHEAALKMDQITRMLKIFGGSSD